MFINREDLFHMERQAIDYTVFVNAEMAEALIDVTYHALPFLIGAVISGVGLYGIYEIALMMDIPRAVAWIWYLSSPTQPWLETITMLSCIITMGCIAYAGYSVICDLDGCLEKAKTERAALLERIDALEKENESMRSIFRKMVTLSEQDLKKIQ